MSTYPQTFTSILLLHTSAYFAPLCSLSTGAQQGYQVGLGVGIPVLTLLTAIISSLLTLLIAYLLTRGRSHKSTPTVQEPVYDPVSSGSSGGVEMKGNVAYGQVTTGGHVTYETVLQ